MSLQLIQQELKAPKNQENTFANFKYRSCEDILEAVKPLLAKHDCVLTISDELVCVGERYYIKATALLKGSDFSCAVTAYAREQESKKGMDASQITGSCSSYARKYALNGLFLIDDTKDADGMDNRKPDKEPPKPITKEQEDEIVGLAVDVQADWNKFLEYFKIKDSKDMLSTDYDRAIKMLEDKGKQGGIK